MYSTGESQEEEGPVHPLLPIYMLTKQKKIALVQRKLVLSWLAR